jgi:hypothetical protein
MKKQILAPRKDRRLAAKKSGVEFSPVYNESASLKTVHSLVKDEKGRLVHSVEVVANV